jgi:hypothetical protein
MSFLPREIYAENLDIENNRESVNFRKRDPTRQRAPQRPDQVYRPTIQVIQRYGNLKNT